MRYIIIGLGIYGSNLAKDLTDMGHEVIGADIKRTNVDNIKDYISTVYLIDATEESALSMLPLNNVDSVIVAIGENFGASVKVVAMLKKLKVKHILARAIDPLHSSILEGFKIDRILTPEQRAASDLTNELALDVRIQSLSIDDDTYVMKFPAPPQLYGQPYADLTILRKNGLKIVAVTRQTSRPNILGISHMYQTVFDYTAPGTVVVEGDTLTVIGTRKNYSNFYKQLQSS